MARTAVTSAAPRHVVDGAPRWMIEFVLDGRSRVNTYAQLKAYRELEIEGLVEVAAGPRRRPHREDVTALVGTILRATLAAEAAGKRPAAARREDSTWNGARPTGPQTDSSVSRARAGQPGTTCGFAGCRPDKFL